ncbi:hypothetical protein CDL12_15866 [Handroanthus impetiginosus]|uniref:Uncharacterized protein n=1 Tax=Handroanthus impetiginosus TaxID=429701 RepID=A0A2G9H223_9LAMI|nr:hypothetical protein CDL12_15866 [Handroanthus impetiginosus]
MPTMIHNKTSEDIEITDRYLTDVRSDSGYDGPRKYRIPPGGMKSISFSTYSKQANQHPETQRIDVRISGENKQMLRRWDFKRNKEIIFEMHNGSMSVTYSPKTRTTLADRIWRLFPFCRSGFNTESPVIPQV